MASVETSEEMKDQSTLSESKPESSAGANGVTSTSPVKDDKAKLASNFLIQGKRFLLLKDFLSAIESLGESCRILSEELPDQLSTNEHAEAHFFYGKALLEQSRIELGVLEGADIGKTEADESGSSEASEDENENSEDEEDKEDEDTVNENGKSDIATKEEVPEPETTTNGVSKDKDENDTKKADSSEDGKEASTDNGKPEEANEVDLNAPSPTTQADGLVIDNEVPSTSSGVVSDAAAEKQAEEELSNLELAWEVLEVAKIHFNVLLNDIKKERNEDKKTEQQAQLSEKEKSLKKRLADTHCSLGEVATESENYAQAIEEFKTGLEILSQIEGSDSREIAQYHFQMGLAYSFDKKFQDALASFRESVEIIKNRISTLKEKIDTKQTAKDLGIELGENVKPETDEVQELTALLPELQEKITDTIDAEKDSKKEEEETKMEDEIIARNSPVKNPNPPAANDISHLVKKKKKAEDGLPDGPPVKKICIDPTSVDIPTNGTSADSGKSDNGLAKVANGP